MKSRKINAALKMYVICAEIVENIIVRLFGTKSRFLTPMVDVHVWYSNMPDFEPHCDFCGKWFGEVVGS